MGLLVLFSPVNAIVTMNSAPVVGAKVLRTYQWRWGDKKYSDDTVTDARGAFHFDKLTGFSLTAWLPHEPVISQTIIVHYKDVVHKVWDCSKRDYALNGELDGREIKVTFQLDMEPQKINLQCYGKFNLNQGKN